MRTGGDQRSFQHHQLSNYGCGGSWYVHHESHRFGGGCDDSDEHAGVLDCCRNAHQARLLRVGATDGYCGICVDEL